MVRLHLTTFLILAFISPLSFGESECDRLHNTYTLRCTDAETQCKGLTHCREIQTKCLPQGTDLSDQQTCGQFQDCVVGYYRDKVATGSAIPLGKQCRYNWDEPITVNRGSSMKSCKFQGLPWDVVSNHCPGASIFYNGGSLSDPFYNCQATQKKYLEFHGECESVKLELKTKCSISIVDDKGRNCSGLNLSPTARAIFASGGVGEDMGALNIRMPSEAVADGSLEAKPNTGFSLFSPSSWSSVFGK